MLDEQIKNARESVLLKSVTGKKILEQEKTNFDKFKNWCSHKYSTVSDYGVFGWLYWSFFFVVAFIATKILINYIIKKNIVRDRKLRDEDLSILHAGTDDPLELAKELAFYKHAYMQKSPGLIPTDGIEVAAICGFDSVEELNKTIVELKDPFLFERHHKNQGDKFRNDKQRGQFRKQGKLEQDFSDFREDDVDETIAKQHLMDANYMKILKAASGIETIKFSEVTNYPLIQIVYEDRDGHAQVITDRGNDPQFWAPPKKIISGSGKTVTTTGTSSYQAIGDALLHKREVFARVYNPKLKRWEPTVYRINHSLTLDSVKLHRAIGKVIGPCGIGAFYCSKKKGTIIPYITTVAHAAYRYQDIGHLEPKWEQGNVTLVDFQGNTALVPVSAWSSDPAQADAMKIQASDVKWFDITGKGVSSHMVCLDDAEDFESTGIAVLVRAKNGGVTLNFTPMAISKQKQQCDAIHKSPVSPGDSGCVFVNQEGEVIAHHVGIIGGHFKAQTIRHAFVTGVLNEDIINEAKFQLKEDHYKLIKQHLNNDGKLPITEDILIPLNL